MALNHPLSHSREKKQVNARSMMNEQDKLVKATVKKMGDLYGRFTGKKEILEKGVVLISGVEFKFQRIQIEATPYYERINGKVLFVLEIDESLYQAARSGNMSDFWDKIMNSAKADIFMENDTSMKRCTVIKSDQLSKGQRITFCETKPMDALASLVNSEYRELHGIATIHNKPREVLPRGRRVKPQP